MKTIDETNSKPVQQRVTEKRGKLDTQLTKIPH